MAQLAGVSEQTIYRRLRSPAFKHRLGQLRNDMLDRAGRILSARAASASVVLCRLMVKAKSETVRLHAAAKLLELGQHHREQADLAQRLEAIEQQLREQARARPKLHRGAI